MKPANKAADRLAKLEDELKRANEKIKELRAEHTEALKLVDEMREQVEACNEQIEQWINAFDMVLGDNGKWNWSSELTRYWDEDMSAVERYEALRTKWNRLVPKYNAVIEPKPIGRPLAASAAQIADVEKRRGKGASLRAIAAATSLSLGTVHTIVRRKNAPRVDPRMHRLELDRARAKIYRARKRQREQLPDQINTNRQRNAELLNAAKGLAEV